MTGNVQSAPLHLTTSFDLIIRSHHQFRFFRKFCLDASPVIHTARNIMEVIRHNLMRQKPKSALRKTGDRLGLATPMDFANMTEAEK